MGQTNEELTSELKELQQKYANLEKKYNEEVEALRKKEEAIRLRLMFLEGIVNSAIDGFLVVNPFGQKIFQNQRTIDLWKVPQEIVDDPDGLKQVDHVMKMTVNPEQFVAEINYLREHPDEKSRDELELIDGTVLDRYSSPVLGTDGINYGRIWTFHDITERKKLEKKLTKLNSDKDRFISILAHDLRNPFNSLVGFSDLLKKKLRTYSIDKIEEIVETINFTARKTYELLEETLLWTSLQSKQIDFSPSTINITTIISEMVDIFKPVAKFKNITIKYIDKKELQTKADVYMFKAVLRNLISNAIKFTDIDGKIKISANQTPTEIIIKVSDNGIGILPENSEKLFNFSTIHSTKGTSGETGTGLGLLLCKEFIDKHEGKIWIDSKINKGTTVGFSLPVEN